MAGGFYKIRPCPAPGPSTSSTAAASSTAPFTRSAASRPAAGCPRTPPTASPPCCASCCRTRSPEHVAVLFDPPGPTFRHEQYAEYKANRPAMDDDLAVQIPYIRRVCEAFRLPIVEVPGFEADDVIATLARQAVAAGFKVVIVTADKDMLQLVDEDVVVLNPGREGAGSTLLDAQGRRGEVGRAAGAHRRRAGARRRRGRQRARRAGDRRQGRARPGARVRHGRGRDRERRQGEARRLPRGAEGPRGRGAALEAARDAAPRRARDARPRRDRLPRARPRRLPRPLQGARVPGPREGVRPAGDGRRRRAPAAARRPGDRRRGRPRRARAGRVSPWPSW